jgi:small subunit ribosomal protein S14
MAKRALINRDEKRRKLVEKFAAKRESLFAVVNDQARTEEERFEAARLEIQALPRNSSPVRLRNRCKLTGRPVAFFASSGWGAASCVISSCAEKFRV